MVRIDRKLGPLYTETQFKDTKDPCPVFDGEQWHIFGSGGNVREEIWKILHAVSPHLDGPWVEADPVHLDGLSGDHIAAPGVLYDNGIFHMFVQTDFLATNGTVEYLTSSDGNVFTRINTALSPIPDSEEAGIYDPHPAIISKKKYLVYSGTPRVTNFNTHFSSRPDIFLAVSETSSWEGPWKRIGKILDHNAIAAHHNNPNDPNYEWGIEGPQLVELPDKKILLNATCFLPTGRFGTRQRTFFAVAPSVEGPYRTLGPVLQENLEAWESGENGHAACILDGKQLHLFYQARSKSNLEDVNANDWRYGIATFDIAPLVRHKIPLLPSIGKIRWKRILPYSLFKTVAQVIKKRIPRTFSRRT